ncbi:hypothetical protein M422DRAFT_72901 [Sphaerobolus stellatus SS14]|nr:hypothetical protein M422DRAFT_72901 [Sphaerobolus stellatus SS14]
MSRQGDAFVTLRRITAFGCRPKLVASHHALASTFNHFAFRIPKAIQASLPASAFFARFDNTGRFIATSRSDFSAVIWDLDTMSEVRVLQGHQGSVTEISWSGNSRYVLTASRDWTVNVWDLAEEFNTLPRMTTHRFDCHVWRASFHPRNSNIILALLITGEAYIIDCRKGHEYRSELVELFDEPGEETSGHEHARSFMTYVEFDPTGKFIFGGTTEGTVLVFRTSTKRMIARHTLSGAGNIKQIKLSRCGRYLLVNSQDRVIRHFEIPTYPIPSKQSEANDGFFDLDLEPIYRFADPVDKVQWNGIGYSADSEWVIGGAADTATHKIYVWDLNQDGVLYEAVEGGRERLVDVQWHPTKAAMASTTIHGNILIWHIPTLEKWSAFAGDFEELDENVEYIEKEDEFDIEDEEELLARKMRAEEEDVDVTDDDDDDVPEPHIRINEKGWDEDIQWADDYPDDDTPNWEMRVIIQEDHAPEPDPPLVVSEA